eukprot:11106932-Heterocapsa_arctica.AAC.1
MKRAWPARSQGNCSLALPCRLRVACLNWTRRLQQRLCGAVARRVPGENRAAGAKLDEAFATQPRGAVLGATRGGGRGARWVYRCGAKSWHV